MKQDLIYFAIYCVPALSAGICLIVLSFYKDGALTPVELKLRRMLKLVYLMRVISWSIVLWYFYNPPMYARFSACYFTINLVALVILCNFIAIITRTDPDKRFSPIHYVIPIFFGLLYQIQILTIPNDILVEVYNSRGEVIPGYESFSNTMNRGIIVRGTYAMIYSVISVINISRYRKFIVNYSTDIFRSSLNWVKLFIILMLVVSTCVGLGTSSIVKKYPLYMLLPLSILFFQHILLCYNLCKRNYEIVWPQLAITAEQNSEQEHTEIDNPRIDKEAFEEYIRREHPYRDSSLKITDMTSDLGTNRTYLSEFINSEYGMNFSTFINLCRLEELEMMQQDSNVNLTNLDLITHVGFGSYDSYLRTKKRRDESLVLSAKQVRS